MPRFLPDLCVSVFFTRYMYQVSGAWCGIRDIACFCMCFMSYDACFMHRLTSLIYTSVSSLPLGLFPSVPFTLLFVSPPLSSASLSLVLAFHRFMSLHLFLSLPPLLPPFSLCSSSDFSACLPIPPSNPRTQNASSLSPGAKTPLCACGIYRGSLAWPSSRHT